jgi:hypothetical protein
VWILLLFDAQVTGTERSGRFGGRHNRRGRRRQRHRVTPAPFSNTDFSLEPSLTRVFPTVTGGNGGGGAGGANATATAQRCRAAQGGKGGAAFITMDHDIFGSAATPYIGFVTITASVDAASIGSADSGGSARRRSEAGLASPWSTGVNGSQDSRGSDGAIGGAGGLAALARSRTPT